MSWYYSTIKHESYLNKTWWMYNFHTLILRKHRFSLIYLTSSRDFEFLCSISTASVLHLFLLDPFLDHSIVDSWVWSAIIGRYAGLFWGVFGSMSSLFLTSWSCSLRSASKSKNSEKLSSLFPWLFPSSSLESSWSWHPGHSLGTPCLKGCRLHYNPSQETREI